MMKPFTDEQMEYDRTEHRYRLTESYVLKRLNRNLSALLADHGGASDTSNETRVFLDRVSRQIYGYCYRCTPYPKARERMMALDESKRGAIRDAMAEQMIYILNNGDLSAYTGVNVETGATIDPYRMRASEIAPMARDILLVAGISSPSFNVRSREITPDYTGEGY